MKEVLAGLLLLIPIDFSSAAPAPDKSHRARVAVISAPRPEYPYEARRAHMVGRGIAVLEVEPSTGKVTHAYMAQSTGYSLLDNATLSAFRHWRFQPSPAKKVCIPIAYTMNAEVITTSTSMPNQWIPCYVRSSAEEQSSMARCRSIRELCHGRK